MYQTFSLFLPYEQRKPQLLLLTNVTYFKKNSMIPYFIFGLQLFKVYIVTFMYQLYPKSDLIEFQLALKFSFSK